MSKFLLLLTFLIASQMLLAGDMIEVTPTLFVSEDTIWLESNELKINHPNLWLCRCDKTFEHDKIAITVFELAKEIQKKSASGVRCETLKSRLAQLVTPEFVYRERDKQHLADVMYQEGKEETIRVDYFFRGALLGTLFFCSLLHR